MKVNKSYKSVRKTWGELNPITRIIESEKGYNRRKEKAKERNQHYED